MAEYPLHRKKDDPDYATQSHTDHMNALTIAMRRAIESAGIDGRSIAAMALDTTGSSVVPVGEGLEPLDDYYLWCDHRAWEEAAQITAAAREEARGHRLVRRRLLFGMGLGEAAALAAAQSGEARPHGDGARALRHGCRRFMWHHRSSSGEPKHLRDGSQVDVERIARRFAVSGFPRKGRSAS